MRTEQIAQLLAVYLLQTAYASSNEQTGMMFGAILDKMLESQNTLGGQAYQSNSKNSTEVFSDIKKIINDSPKDLDEAIKEVSRKYGVEEELIRAVIKQESGFNQNAVSKAGAIGLMQLMPSTAKSLGVNPYDALENLDGGTRYLRNLLNSFSGNKALALAAYNGGIGRMKRLGVDTVEEISKMPTETRNYVNKVLKNYEQYKKL
ncbi:lytic transglycosylase domain-containing protein [Caloramator proteoclasticus]|uniref:Transglycosylase SLT domain-containing protein n=1 Tax=Caloramator proteoclasticus DSM 10124 TaxID=1121262 RepID=A0A1M4VZJ8_9CLOT|nr:lytic transglycosylase domain-containing protein [Caloramator proteoclasticus]SHE74303.1 Transglycosylase SLT domain-containing protein [Caloramator proteoclasticus DSM 10124]